MSEPSAFGFGQFVPGFDFLQNLSKTASAAQPTAAAGMPGMASWVAPTLSIEDIDKRIQELKSVLFWLEQNTTALKATIQAMEVQKMTLTTLQSMNVNMADLAKAFTAKPPSAPSDLSTSAASVAPEATPAAPKPSLFTPKPAAAPPASEPAQPQSSNASAAAQEPTPQASSDATDATAAAKPAVDPMQWWGALTQQFQGIAAAALKDVAADAMKAGVSTKAARAQAAAPGKAGKAPAKGTVKGAPQKPQAAKASAKAPAKSARQATVKVAVKTAVKTKSAPRKASSK